MKNLIANLKGQDYKRLAVEHGEKILLGAVVLLVLVVWIGTPWVPYDADPADLQRDAAWTRQTVAAAQWPAREEVLYATPAGALHSRAKEELAPVSTEQYALVNDFFWPIRPKEIRVRETEWLPVGNLLADAAQVLTLVHGQPTPEQLAELERIKANPRPAGALELDPFNVRPVAPRIGEEPLQQEVDLTIPPVGVSRRVVGVRGVYHLRRQLEAIAKASNLATRDVDPALLQIIDFELMRQTAVPGSDPWSGPWTKVDIQNAVNVLNDAYRWEEEVVDSSITDNVFTMDMPFLVFGEYGPLATHPDVLEFHLSPEGQRVQEELNRALALEKEIEEANKPPKGGFDLVKVDLSSRLKDFRLGKLETVLDRLNEKLTAAELEKLGLVKASGNVLLYRYFDFDVASGETYRYKVRFKVVNPNFNKPITDVQSPQVALEQFRFTPWSDPTPPVTVPQDTEYYVTHIAPGRPGQPVATFEMFQWYEKVGTLVAARLRAEFGALIGGQVKANVAHPGPPDATEPFALVQAEQVPFYTRDVLIDVIDPPAIDESLHADLGKGAKVVAQALVADADGELVGIDPVSRELEREQAILRWQEQWAELNARLPTPEEEDRRLDDLVRDKFGPRNGTGNDRAEQRRRRLLGGENPGRRQVDPYARLRAARPR
ncbi:MAG: hypothetical protein WED34_07735 [Planctomycetales bacterium]